MKQIMDLFAKERKARKKEIIKLRGKLADNDTQIAEDKNAHQKEKKDIMERWKHDSMKHQEFYDYINKKVEQAEKQGKEYKKMCYYLEQEKKELMKKLDYYSKMDPQGSDVI